MASLGRNLFANYLGKTWSALLSLLLIPIYIKFMGIESYGLIGFYTTLTSIFGILDFGLGATVNREIARRSVKNQSSGSPRDVIRTLEPFYWGIALVSGLTIYFSAPFIATTWITTKELEDSTVFNAVRLMGISLAVQFPVYLYQGGLFGLQKQVLVNVILIITGTIRSLGAIFVLWYFSPTIETFLTWQCVMVSIGTIAFLFALWRNIPETIKPARFIASILREIWKYAAAISVNAMIGIVLSQLDKVILSKMLPLKMFGYYTIAGTVASSVWMIIIPFSTAVFPQLVQLHELRKNVELQRLFHRSSQILSFILLPICAVLILFSKEILLVWMNDPLIIKNCYLIVSFLVLGTMLNGLATLPAISANAFGWPILVTYTNAIQAIIIVPLIILMAALLQGIGASIAWVMLNSTYILFMAPIFFKRYLSSVKWRWYKHDIILPLIVAFSICSLSKALIPQIDSVIFVVTWIALTGLLSLIATGLVLPHVRPIVIYIWDRSFKPSGI
jgi:O-antigen/teichoic acid export membrane protein